MWELQLRKVEKGGFTNGINLTFYVRLIVKNNTSIVGRLRGIYNWALNHCEREELRDWLMLRPNDQSSVVSLLSLSLSKDIHVRNIPVHMLLKILRTITDESESNDE